MHKLVYTNLERESGAGAKLLSALDKKVDLTPSSFLQQHLDLDDDGKVRLSGDCVAVAVAVAVWLWLWLWLWLWMWMWLWMWPCGCGA